MLISTRCRGVTVTLTDTGTGTTLTQPAQPSDAEGKARGTIVGTVAETVLVSARAGETELWDTAVVTFLGPDLVAGKTAPPTVMAGMEITYTVTVENQGPVAAMGVVLTDTLPDGVDFVSQTSSLPFRRTGQSLVWQAGGMAAGETISVVATGLVSPSLGAGVDLVNQAEVYAATAENEPGNNTASASTSVLPSYGFNAWLEHTSLTTTPGQPVWTWVRVQNSGYLADAYSLTVSGLDPAWYTLAPTGLSLSSGQSGQATFTVLVTDNVVLGMHPFTVTVTSQAGGETVVANGQLDLRPSPSMVEASPQQPFVGAVPGQTTELPIQVFNRSLVTATDVQVALPTTMPWLTATVTALGDLSPGESSSFVLSAHPPVGSALGYYQGYVHLTCAEGAEAYVALTVFVSSEDNNQVTFHLDDEVGHLVEGAEVTMIRQEKPGGGYPLTFQTHSDADGQAHFSAVPVGTYDYYIVAADHESVWDQVEVTAGGSQALLYQGRPGLASPLAQGIQIYQTLALKYVSYEWSVTETAIPDQYQVTLTSTYEYEGRPLLVMCAAWLEVSTDAGSNSGTLTILNPSGIDVQNVQVSTAGLQGISLSLDDGGQMGDIPAGGQASLGFTASGNVGDDYQAGHLLVVGQYTTGGGQVKNISTEIKVLANSSQTTVCECSLEGGQFVSQCYYIGGGGGSTGYGSGVGAGVGGGAGGGGIVGGNLVNSPPPFNYYWGWVFVTEHGTAHLSLSQDATLERQAFWAQLDLASLGQEISDLDVSVVITDAEGHIANSGFAVDDSQAAQVTAIPAGSSASLLWTLVPTSCLAGDQVGGRRYYAHAVVTFTVPSEPGPLVFDTEAAAFTVHPQPQILLQYYLPYEVKADKPFDLNVAALNWGYGVARNLRLTAPQFDIEDDSDNPIQFTILDQDLDFGTMPSGGQALGYVRLEANADGHFTDFDGALQHVGYQGLDLDPLIISTTTYLIYEDHVEKTSESGLGAGGDCLLPGPPSQLPDLTVKVLSAPERPDAGDTVQVQAKVTCLYGEVNKTVTVRFEYYHLEFDEDMVSGKAKTRWVLAGPPSDHNRFLQLGPGESVIVTDDFTVPTAGSYQVKVTVDPE